MNKKQHPTIFFAALLALILVASVQAARVTQQQAEQAAAQWLTLSSNRLGAQLPPDIDAVTDYTTFFTVQLQPEGYLILSPDSLIEPVIAFSANGTFQLDEDNPLTTLLQGDLPDRLRLADFIETHPYPTDTDIELYQQARRSSDTWQDLLAATTPPPDGTSTISDVRIAPFVQSRWSQSTAQGHNCYNYYTPSNYVDGCVATAMAQVMRHLQYPQSAIGLLTNTIYVMSQARTAVTRGGNGTGGAYDWTNMPLNPATASYSDAQWRMIGALCYDCGVAARMNYSASGSSAYYSYAQSAMTAFFQFGNADYTYGASGVTAANRQLAIKPNLAAGIPVMLGIRRSAGGHAVVCDGFGYTSSTEYHHINLGWGGSYDAWYNLPLIDAGSYVYTNIDAVLFNLFTNGTGELIGGRILDNSAHPVSGALVTATGGHTSQTDSNGYYAIRVPSSASYNLTASKPGYADGTRNSISVGTSSGTSIGNYWGADLTMTQYTFAFRALALTNNIILRWTDPLNIAMPTSSSMVRRSTAAYPETSADGTSVYIGLEQVYEDTGLTPEQTNYYTIFVHDGAGWTNPPGD